MSPQQIRLSYLAWVRTFRYERSPSGDGVVERSNKVIIIKALTKMKLDSALSIDCEKRVAALALQFNCAYNVASGNQPFVAFTVRTPLMPADLSLVLGVATRANP